ncbi:MAG: hypothetical protein MUF18_15050 [Fimbriiglobus sp.]|jgi:hypothetical protein|nr:hypothetical protein [Fimbriiglobus sp.]
MTPFSPTSENHVFRIPFWRMYLTAVVYAQVFFVPAMWTVFYLISRVNDDPFPSLPMAGMYVLGSLALTLVLAPAFWVYVRRLVVKVTPESLTCSNGLGKLVTVPWKSVVGVRPIYLPGFPYLLLRNTRTRLQLWLPLFLGRLPEFTELVGHFAGTDHLLYQALWPRVEQK